MEFLSPGLCNFVQQKTVIFSYLSVKMCVLGVQNRLIEMVPLSTHNICLAEK